MNNELRKKKERAFDGIGVKKVGIAVDVYKSRSFKRKLIIEGFNITESKPFTPGTMIIFLIVEGNRMYELERLCWKMNINFKHSN